MVKTLGAPPSPMPFLTSSRRSPPRLVAYVQVTAAVSMVFQVAALATLTLFPRQ